VVDCATKAVLVTRRSLRAGLEIVVATIVAVAVAPLSRHSTVQKDPPGDPTLQLADTRFSASGMGSPKTTSVAASGPIHHRDRVSNNFADHDRLPIGGFGPL
jgi:hypothetical protein